MRLERLAFLLSILAGAICLCIYFYKMIEKEERDYTILVIGIFMIALGSSSFYKSRKGREPE